MLPELTAEEFAAALESVAIEVLDAAGVARAAGRCLGDCPGDGNHRGVGRPAAGPGPLRSPGRLSGRAAAADDPASPRAATGAPPLGHRPRNRRAGRPSGVLAAGGRSAGSCPEHAGERGQPSRRPAAVARRVVRGGRPGVRLGLVRVETPVRERQPRVDRAANARFFAAGDHHDLRPGRADAPAEQPAGPGAVASRRPSGNAVSGYTRAMAPIAVATAPA